MLGFSHEQHRNSKETVLVPGIASRFSPFPSMAEQVQSGPQQSRARRFLGAGKRTLDGEDRSERIKTGRKGTLFRAFSPTIKPEFPFSLNHGVRRWMRTRAQCHAVRIC